MTKENIVYSLIQISLFNSDTLGMYRLPQKDWEDVYEECCQQAIVGIPAEWIFSHVSLPRGIEKSWKNKYLQQVGFFYRLIYAQNELVHLLESAQIPMAILKGTAAAMYYPIPVARTMGDVDFLVPEENFWTAYEWMLKNGYELQYDEGHVDYHITLCKDGITYEIHNKPAGMPDGEIGKFLQFILEDGVKNCRMIDMEGCKIPVLPAFQNGIVLLLHIVKHLKSGLGLRQVLDWMMYVDQELNDEMWKTQMQPVLKKTGYEKLAKAVTRICQIYLGLREDTITWCLNIDEDVCRTLMSYVMTQGNFGKKIQEEDKGVKIAEAIHGPFQFLQLHLGSSHVLFGQLVNIVVLLSFLFGIDKFLHLLGVLCQNHGGLLTSSTENRLKERCFISFT